MLRLSRTVIALGFVSLFTDVSSEMIVPLLPVFFTAALGASAAMLGMMEGAAETVAALLKLAGGRWSDASGKRKSLVLAGYSLSALMRPLLAVCVTPWQGMAVRLGDRVGKGLRTAPRDALLAAAAAENARGWVFGFHRAMDHVGAMIGALIAALLVGWVGMDTRSVFAWAAVPGALAVATLLIYLREEPRAAIAPAAQPLRRSDLPRLGGDLKRFFIPLALFTLANSSDAFLLLQAQRCGVSLAWIPILWVVLHLAKTASNLVGGHLSDLKGRRAVITTGWATCAAVYALFAAAAQPWHVWVLFALYGLYHGLTEGAEKALVADLAGPEVRGTAFGAYHLLTGIVALPASLLTGWLWDLAGAGVALGTGAGLAFLAAALLAVMVRKT